MLLPRILTALILIPATFAVLFYLPPFPFLLVTAVIALYGAWEWAGLMGLNSIIKKLAYVLVMLIAGVNLLVLNDLGIYTPIAFLITVFIWWIIALLLVLAYPRLSTIWGRGILTRGLMGIFVLLPFWWTLNFIRADNTTERFLALVFLLILIWGADSAAYFIGRKWGKHKLIPVVSPGKSWEGCIAAFICTILISVITFILIGLPKSMWVPGIILSLVVIFFSIVGDLFESMIKRYAQVKDSGNLLPGHGGILDRIDSLTAATPIFALGAWIIMTYYS